MSVNNESSIILFYGHTPGKPFACFSNWYPAEFEKDGIRFSNTEQYMMYRKALLMGDDEIAKEVLSTPDPKSVKALGRKVRNWNEDLWVKNRERIMFDGCLAKFSAPENAKMHAELLSTGNKVIAEASPYDKIWGIGMRSTDKGADEVRKWKGLNLLGATLMKVRDTLRYLQ